MNEAQGGRRVAFFGGSFDPPHLGHLAVARAARMALRLDTVLFAPVGAQPLKPQGSATDFDDRMAMTQLAIAAEPGFELSLADAPKPSAEPNYTLETLLGLRSGLPLESVLYCLMGADSFMSLRYWWRAAEIPFVAPLVVASRPGQPLADLRAALPAGLMLAPAAGLAEPEAEKLVHSVEISGEAVPDVKVQRWTLLNQSGDQAPFYLLSGLYVDISASEIREQVRAAAESHSPAHALLPGKVAEYIRARSLYK